MSDMKSACLLFLVIPLFLVSRGIVAARAVRPWSYQELLEQSDLVVIAVPTSTSDTKERNLPGFVGQPVIGMETRFAVAAVLKGDRSLTNLVLHHYRPAQDHYIVPNGPTFVYFALSDEPSVRRKTYILFLRRETDDRYAPVAGQTDPGLGVRELGGVYESAVIETQTKLGLHIANVLKQCQTIKPGMTRAALSKVFSTEGGLSSVTHRSYVYRDCPYIKVDVDFAPLAAKQDVERPTDVVTRISKPYLDWSVAD